MSYIVNVVAYVFIWLNYRKMVELRWDWFRSEEYQDSLHARSLMTTHIPKKYQTDRGLNVLFNELKVVYPTTAVFIGRPAGKVPQLIKEHNESVRELEAVLNKYLNQQNRGRPTVRKGGIFGRKVDAIEYYVSAIPHLLMTFVTEHTNFS
jgi:calcium permeable stress-gated cation channel